jgi:hypothetical protein
VARNEFLPRGAHLELVIYNRCCPVKRPFRELFGNSPKNASAVPTVAFNIAGALKLREHRNLLFLVDATLATHVPWLTSGCSFLQSELGSSTTDSSFAPLFAQQKQTGDRERDAKQPRPRCRLPEEQNSGDGHDRCANRKNDWDG